MVYWIIVLFGGLGWSTSWAEGFDYSRYDRVLKSYVTEDGLVRYADLKKNAGDLNAFIAQITTVGPETKPEMFPTKADSLSYWINVYNAIVVHGIIAAYPVASVKDIALFYGFFKRNTFLVDGQKRTLDNIEHDILRPIFKDPRIHAAINCAAISCPNLQNRAFLPATLDAQLDAAMKKMIQSPKHVRLDQKNNRVFLSKIFDWFGTDFTHWYDQTHGVQGATLTAYLSLYLSEADRQYLKQHRQIQVEFNDYDWSLNQVKPE